MITTNGHVVLPTSVFAWLTGPRNSRLRKLVQDIREKLAVEACYVVAHGIGDGLMLANDGILSPRTFIFPKGWSEKIRQRLLTETFIASPETLEEMGRYPGRVMMRGVPYRFFCNIVFPTVDSHRGAISLVAVSWSRSPPDTERLLSELVHMVDTAALDVRGLFETLVEMPLKSAAAIGGLQEGAAEMVPASPVNLDVVSQFLLRSLADKPRLRARSGQPFLVLCAWKKSIKDEQINALRAIKHNPPSSLVDVVAKKFAKQFEMMMGRDTFRAVTSVACGNSGSECLAKKLAQSFAEVSGIRYVQAFEDLPKLGSSHPKNNVRLPPLKLRSTIEEPVILIDDVATSGKHIENAAKLLKRSAPAVYPMAWVSD